MDLSENRLCAFPEDVLQCATLEILKLSGNQLTEIPVIVGQCAKLKELHIASNCLQALPAELGQCTALEHMDCSSNQLSFLPPELGNLKKLRRLVLNNNQQLQFVPADVLQGCILLHTLEMHGTLVSREVRLEPRHLLLPHARVSGGLLWRKKHSWKWVIKWYRM